MTSVRLSGAGAVRGSRVEQAQPLERRRLQCYLALMLGDMAAIFIGFLSSGYAYLGEAGLGRGALLAQLLLPVFLTIALYNDAYSLAALQAARRGIARAIGALAIAAGVVVFIAFYLKASQDFSRVIFTGGVLAAMLALAGLRSQLRGFIAWRCGRRVVNQLVIDDGGPAIALPGALRADARVLRLIPALDDPQALNRIALALQAIDRVVISCPPARRAAWAAVLRSANIAGEVIDETVAELGAHGARLAGGQGLLRVSVGPLGMRARVAKRGFDLIVASLGLLALAPLMLAVVAAILIEDGRPVLFRQRRVGRSNRFFAVVKFRSMRVAGGDPAGTVSTGRADPRVTRVGAVIRRTSIDELPQLLNVLRGEMSIVGPRPHALGSQAGDKLFWQVDARYWERHALKPGLTGLAQVRGLRGATTCESDLEARLKADLEYLDGWSIWRDLRIVVLTLRVLVHQRAY